MKPFTLRLFFPDGDPYSIKVAKLGNWSGVGVMFPRALLGEARKRPELGRPGVYLLLGEDEDGFPELYIGEADDVGKRIAQHDQGKDFWTHAVVFTASEDEGLDKAQTRYLEARLIELAKSRGQAKIKNQNQGSLPPLSEMDRADAEQFLENLLLCLPPLGVSFLGPKSPKKQAGVQKFYLSSKGVHAEAELTAEGFVVKKGSQAVLKETRSLPQSYKRLRQRLVEAGILKTAGDHYVFTRDFVFSSPSAAAAAIRGGSTQGTTYWKTKDGTTFKEWLAASSA